MASKERQRQNETDNRHRIADYWLVDRGKAINDPRRKQIMRDTEQHALAILPQLGFTYVLPLNKTIRVSNGRNHHLRSTFPFDIYAERDGEKWFVEVTGYIVKMLPRTPLWNRLGIRIGVLFIRRDLQKYCFKEAKNNNVSVSLRLKDIGLDPKDPSGARRLAWQNRRSAGPIVGWNKGLTKETDVRIAKQAESMHCHQQSMTPENRSEIVRKGYRNGRVAWNKGLNKETDERIAEHANKSSWCKGLTKDTDERVARRDIASKVARGFIQPNLESTDVK